ncbi:MAG: L,D-transpeptidase family protein [Sulfurovum sp.]|nr:L,D-transpeptidase family protein [Sulfurovum sp.]MDD3602893.1 L,D-transpeptidase family protein [Sulfurovum sp.]
MLRLKIFFFLAVLTTSSVWPDRPKIKGSQTIPISKTEFLVIHKNQKKEKINLSGKDFILVSVREKGSDGRFYAVDRDGTVWWSGAVTSGAPEFASPSGIFTVIQKRRYHMSTAFPDPSGINNMDYMIKFTHRGHALHQGSVDWMSHGCIHVDKKDIPAIFKWSRIGMPIVVTRHSYMPYAQEDLRKIYLKR